MPLTLPVNPNLEHLKFQAKALPDFLQCCVNTVPHAITAAFNLTT